MHQVSVFSFCMTFFFALSSFFASFVSINHLTKLTWYAKSCGLNHAFFSLLILDFGECPLSSQMSSCTPKCIQDNECSTMGGICCPNLCNTKSCVRPKSGSQGSNGGYKGSKGTNILDEKNLNFFDEFINFPRFFFYFLVSTATGVYCGNVKCSSYEKCDLDKSTKRQKCVRT